MRQLPILAQRVLLTVAYCDQFSYPLTSREIWLRLISLPANEKVTTFEQVAQAIEVLIKKKILENHDHFVFLAGHAQHVRVRQTRADWSSQKKHEIAEVLEFARRISWIQAIFVTGSMAMANIEQDSDIDFLIVTAPKRVWLTRLLMSLFAQLKGKRRRWRGEEKNSWCFNLWLDTNSLQVASAKQGVYRAYEVAQAQAVFDRNNTVATFYQQNFWVKKFLPNWWQEFASQHEKAAVHRSRNVWWLTLLDHWAWRVQQWYMRPHQTIEKTAQEYAFFHPRDTEKIIYHRWLHALRSVLPVALVKKLQSKLALYD